MNLLVDELNHPDAIVVLDDGTVFKGRSCGAVGEIFGAIAFDTDIFGYQRALGAEENAGSIVAFTYPQVGNFGINAEAPVQAVATGVVVHDMVYTPSSWQCLKSLPDYLVEQGVVGIEDIDVRALTAHLREHPGSWAVISTATLNPEVLRARLLAVKGGVAHA